MYFPKHASSFIFSLLLLFERKSFIIQVIHLVSTYIALHSWQLLLIPSCSGQRRLHWSTYDIIWLFWAEILPAVMAVLTQKHNGHRALSGTAMNFNPLDIYSPAVTVYGHQLPLFLWFSLAFLFPPFSFLMWQAKSLNMCRRQRPDMTGRLSYALFRK